MSEHSPELGELFTALSTAQGEFEAVGKTASNPFYKSAYAPLPEVVKAAAPILTRHGLAIAQFPGHDEHGDTLTTWLTHKSGQFISDTMQLRPIKQDPQAHGSAMTYGRRYAYMAALGLVADEDDDGNAASRGRATAHKANGHASPVTARPPQHAEKPATAKQRGLINAKAGEKRLAAATLGNLLLAAGGQEPREFVSDDQAQQFVNRNLDRLPGRLVDQVLTAIDQCDPQDIPA